jgi:transcriptional regulator with XRE-family HTH domain
MLALGQAIRSLRTIKGISQKDLAERAEITPSFLSLVEGNHRAASLTVLRRIAEALEVAPEVLIWEAVELPEGLSEEDRRMCEFAKVIVRRVYEHAARTANDPESLHSSDRDPG